ncbi:hypothetical protein QP168_10295, partial [Aerococcus urinae]|nr:hypothetical protein [Aerococcus urinae]
ASSPAFPRLAAASHTQAHCIDDAYTHPRAPTISINARMRQTHRYSVRHIERHELSAKTPGKA